MVEDYTKKFSNLPIHCQIDKNDCQLLSGYKASLFPEVKKGNDYSLILSH